MFGDVDGVLVVPRAIVEDVIEKALEKAAGEKLVRKAIEGGMSATDAFAKFGIL
jgi:regulator of RNase E activity RraA